MKFSRASCYLFLSCNVFFSAVLALYQVLTHLNKKTTIFLFIVPFIFLQACGKTKNSRPNGDKWGSNMLFYYPCIHFIDWRSQTSHICYKFQGFVSSLYDMNFRAFCPRDTRTCYTFQHLLLDQSPYKQLIRLLCFFFIVHMLSPSQNRRHKESVDFCH